MTELMYVLKFSACLIIFLGFYSFFLERESTHVLKRYYLLAAVVLALCIPFITFTTYVDPAITNSFPLLNSNSVDRSTDLLAYTNLISVNYWSIVIWSMYGLGVLVFGIRFLNNLLKIFINCII